MQCFTFNFNFNLLAFKIKFSVASLLPQRKCVVRVPWSMRGCNTTSTKYTYSMAFEFCMHICMTSQKEMIVCLRNCGVGLNSFLYVLRIHHQNKCTCSFRNWQAGPNWNILLSLSLSLFFFPPLLLLPPPPPFPPPPSPTSSSFSSLFSPPPSPLSSPPPLDPSQC